MKEIKIKKLDENAIIPSYESEFAAGADLYSCVSGEPVKILPGQTELIHTGVAMAIPVGYVGLVYARSGLATKFGLAPANKVGVIDCDYRGEILVSLYNQSNEIREVGNHERIAQIVITPYELCSFKEVELLNATRRGEGGFGSTGIK